MDAGLVKSWGQIGVLALVVMLGTGAASQADPRHFPHGTVATHEVGLSADRVHGAFASRVLFDDATDTPAENTAPTSMRRPEWQLVIAGVFLLLLSVGMLLILPATRRRIAARNSEDGTDEWARLDKIVAREQVLRANGALPA